MDTGSRISKNRLPVWCMTRPYRSINVSRRFTSSSTQTPITSKQLSQYQVTITMPSLPGRWTSRLKRSRLSLSSSYLIPRRSLHLAPPFLLDDHVPRYMTLTSRDAAKKRSLAYSHLRNCNLCPRECGVDRFEKTGLCLIGEKLKVNTIAPHFGEGLTPTHE